VNVLCTEAERDLILAGARHLVVPGDPGCEGCHDRWTHAKIHGDEGWLPPQRWVDTTGPCPTCDGVHEWMQNWPGPNDLGRIKKVCTDCIDGRKRVALAAPCPTCQGQGEVDVDHGLMFPCGTCGVPDDQVTEDNAFLNGTGRVVFAHATVEVLPVYEYADDVLMSHKHVTLHRWTPEWEQKPTAVEGQLWTGDRWIPLTLDPLPVPGRDWVVVLYDVEMV
jgi:hypothetical protein